MALSREDSWDRIKTAINTTTASSKALEPNTGTEISSDENFFEPRYGS